MRTRVDRRMTLQEWADDPDGWAALHTVLPADHPARTPRLRSLLGPMPIDALAGFGMFGVTHADVDELLARLHRT